MLCCAELNAAQVFWLHCQSLTGQLCQYLQLPAVPWIKACVQLLHESGVWYRGQLCVCMEVHNAEQLATKVLHLLQIHTTFTSMHSRLPKAANEITMPLS